MIEKIFDIKDKVDHNKRKKYLTVIVEEDDYEIFKETLDKVVRIYDCDIVRGLYKTTMSIVMNHDRFLRLLDKLSSQGYAMYAYPSTRILYTLVKM